MENKKRKSHAIYKWIQNARIYQILIDRYAGYKEQYSIDDLKKNFIYGNLHALTNKLDYIKSMNFNMIWISPFYVNQPNGYHGYHAINFNHVDPRFAFGEKPPNNDIGDPFDPNDVDKETEADLELQQFIKECHKRNLLVMMDLVPNHVYKTHPLFLDALKNPNSKYRNWFYFLDNPKNKYVPYMTFLSVGDLPKLNLENDECRKHLVDSTNKFLSYGIDAIRVDHCIGPSLDSLKKIVQEIHKSYPDVPFIGECLTIGTEKDSDTLFSFKNLPKDKIRAVNMVTLNTLKDLDDVFLIFKDVLDGVLDFTFQIIVSMYADGHIDENQCLKEIEKHFERFRTIKDFVLVKNVDSHDADRILFKCKNNSEKFYKILNMLYKTYNNRNDPLIVYYGTEDSMTQDRSIFGESYGDYRCRMPMKFSFQYMKKFFSEQK